STYSAKAPHPYMQKSQTLDFCLVLDGEITLVLDTAEVNLKAGDTVVQRGTNHAWSNRSTRPCTIAFSSHDAAAPAQVPEPVAQMAHLRWAGRGILRGNPRRGDDEEISAGRHGAHCVRDDRVGGRGRSASRCSELQGAGCGAGPVLQLVRLLRRT